MGGYSAEFHWYLPMIGLDPVRQGRGYGSALLPPRVLQCHKDHLAGYLESSNPANIPLYERHRFVVLGTIQVGLVTTDLPNAPGRSVKRDDASPVSGNPGFARPVAAESLIFQQSAPPTRRTSGCFLACSFLANAYGCPRSRLLDGVTTAPRKTIRCRSLGFLGSQSSRLSYLDAM
jgi:hypothetical protein